MLAMRRIPGWPRTGSVDPPPPPTSRRDIAIAVVLVLVALADIPEGVAMWQPASFLTVLVASLASYWRRGHPLAAATAGFGAQLVADVASGIAGTEFQATLGHIIVLGVLVYALGRWGTWRAIVIGFASATAFAVVGEAATAVPKWAQLADDALIWGIAAAGAIALRYRAALLRTRAEQIRSEERERIARDLHDVVAHHVSAIAIQAEGARAAAHDHPDQAVAALETIHTTASTTLTEMRRMVSILRDDTEVGTLAPKANVEELRQLLAEPNVGPPVDLTLSDNLDTLSPSVAAAVLRITQEAVTNARRHSHNARSVDVSVERLDRSVEINVTDDGDRTLAAMGNGYGIIGMTERCTMLGGTLTAAPLRPRGWRVSATIPIDGTVV